NREVAARVISDNGLDKAPDFASPTNFFSDVVIVDEVRGASILNLTGHLHDPQLVAKVVNDVARIGAETARRVSQDEAAQARDEIKQQLDDAKARLDIAESGLQRARSTYQVELLKKDADAALKARGDYLELLINIEAERARVTKGEQELAKRQRLDTVQR